MKRLIGATLAALALAGTVVNAASEQGKRKKDVTHGSVVHAGDDRSSVAFRVAFGSREVEVMRAHYAPRYRNLPKGLAKKVARGKPLPPGWQKKWEPLPAVVERELAVLPPHHHRGVFEGHAVIYNSRTQTVIDIAVLF